MAPYVAQDKTKLLALYEKNNIYKINQKKYDVISKEARSIDKIKKPLYEHRSFFVKPEANKDYIAKEEYPPAYPDSNASTTCYELSSG